MKINTTEQRTRNRATQICLTDVDKSTKAFNRGRIIFSTNDVGAIGCLGQKKKKSMLNPQFKQKATQKWIVDLNVRYKTIKLLEKKNERKVSGPKVKAKSS